MRLSRLRLLGVPCRGTREGEERGAVLLPPRLLLLRLSYQHPASNGGVSLCYIEFVKYGHIKNISGW